MKKRQAGPVRTEEREGILAAILSGMSQNAVARQYGRSIGTVNAIAQQAGLINQAPKAANEARKSFAQAERLALIDELVAKLRDLLPSTTDANQLQHLATTAAILIDKRRLEDGEATSRSEVSNANDARDRIARRIDELAARRGAQGAA